MTCYVSISDPITISRHVFVDLVHNYPGEGHGVAINMSNFFFTKPLTSSALAGQWKKREEIRKLELPGFTDNIKSITTANRLELTANFALQPNDPPEHIVDAYGHEAPVVRAATFYSPFRLYVLMLLRCAQIDTDTYLVWLRKLVEDKGATVEKLESTLKGELIDQESALRIKYKADAILNATGLGALTLAPDELAQPIR